MNSRRDNDAFGESFIESTQPKLAKTTPRSWLPLVLLVGVGVVIVSRSFWLQVVEGASFRERAEHNRVFQVVTEAPRGIIYDRNGTPLVSNISATDLIFDPKELPSREEEFSLIDNLLELLPELSPEEVRSGLEKSRTSGQPVIIARSLEHDTVLRLEEQQDRIHGTQLISSLVRNYTPSHAAAHIIGYTGLVSSEEIEQDPKLTLTDKVGKQGIEKVYDNALRGSSGIRYQEVNASGQLQEQLGGSEPTTGQDVQLTIDIELQEFIYGLFSERAQKIEEDKDASGAVIVLDPRSGAILAAVSFPSFDPNTFSQPSRQKEVSQYFSDSSRPLFNRVLDGTFASGSTIKPFLAAAALEENIIEPNTSIFSSGGITIGQWSFPDWKAGGHGPTDVKKAIAESVNTFFYEITGGYESQPGLGVDTATSYLHDFGWGEPTGIDLSSEATGFLPSQEWKERIKGEPWYIGDTYHLGIGQGDVLVTPIQLAMATGGLADGRYLRTPYLVDGEHKRTPLPVSLQNVEVVREGMRQTVTDGSARSLSNIPIPIAGKTGTAQIGGTEKTHAWFTSFAPYDAPEIVLTVLLEKGGEGDKDAVPFAREIWQWLEERYFAASENVNSQ